MVLTFSSSILNESNAFRGFLWSGKNFETSLKTGGQISQDGRLSRCSFVSVCLWCVYLETSMFTFWVGAGIFCEVFPGFGDGCRLFSGGLCFTKERKRSVPVSRTTCKMVFLPVWHTSVMRRMILMPQKNIKPPAVCQNRLQDTASSGFFIWEQRCVQW